MDRESRRRWELQIKAKKTMLERTHIPEARWWAVEAVDRKQARLNCIRPLLTQVPCGAIEHELSTNPLCCRTEPAIRTICARRCRNRCGCPTSTEEAGALA
jgi:hypothetical protein